MKHLKHSELAKHPSSSLLLMTDSPHTERKKLRIWQQNIAKSKHTNWTIMNGTNPLHDQWDLICIQEPWLDHLGYARTTNKWRTVYPKKHWNRKNKVNYSSKCKTQHQHMARIRHHRLRRRLSGPP